MLACGGERERPPGKDQPGAKARRRSLALSLMSVGLDVLLRSLAGVVQRMLVVGAREMRVMCCLLVVPAFVVFRGLPVVTGRMLVMVGGLVVMLGGFLRHDPPPAES